VLRIEDHPRGARITVRVQPRASRDAIVGVHGDALKVALRSPPVEGAANAALVERLAEWLDVAPRRVTVVRGDLQRTKTVEIEDLQPHELRALLRARGVE